MKPGVTPSSCTCETGELDLSSTFYGMNIPPKNWVRKETELGHWSSISCFFVFVKGMEGLVLSLGVPLPTLVGPPQPCSYTVFHDDQRGDHLSL